tara:strand:+ start:181 stop:717 length:537 start_codon:yes stop_codon:yes gene_type:complete
MKEEWRKVSISDNYEVSNLGRVKRLEKSIEYHNGRGFCKKILPEKILKPCKGLGGYIIYSIDSKSFRGHTLVAQVFLKRESHMTQVNHKNGIKDDNRVCNLEWCTPSENSQHAHDTGLSKVPAGELNHSSKLTKTEVLQIKILIQEGGMLQKDIAIMYNVKDTTISDIKHGKRWNHVR